MKPPTDTPERKAEDVPNLLPAIPDASSAITNAIKGEVDSQIATAHAFPRDMRTFLMELKTMATLSVEVASSCFYKLRRKEKDGTTKTIEGPSVRFAELAVYAYRNSRIQARTSHDDGSYVYCVGTALDLERNVGIQTEVRRRITTREGRRFSDDMVAVTANAGNSIALRNAAFRMIPKALWEPIYEEAKKTAIGTQKSFGDRKAGMVDHFVNKVGLTVEELCAYLEIPNLESMTMEHLEDAIGLATGLKDGDIKIDEVKAKATPTATPAADAPKVETPLGKLTEQLKQEQQPPAATGPITPPPNPEPPPFEKPAGWNQEEENAFDLKMAEQDATTTAPPPGPAAAADIAGKVKDLAGKKKIT